MCLDIHPTTQHEIVLSKYLAWLANSAQPVRPGEFDPRNQLRR